VWFIDVSKLLLMSNAEQDGYFLKMALVQNEDVSKLEIINL